MSSQFRTQRSLWPALLIVAAVTMACSGSEQPAADSRAADSSTTIILGARDVTPVALQPLASGISISGSLDPAQRVEVKAQMAGQLTRVAVERGTPVQSGQVLATIDAGALRAQLASAEAALASAERDLNAIDTLFKRGAISERDHVQARVARDAAVARIAQVRDDLSKTTVRSPITGVVSDRLVETGEAIQVATSLFTVVNATTLELTGRVAPDVIGSVRVGLPARITLDAYPGRAFTGRVARIEPVAEAGTRQVAVYIHVANADRQLVGGLYASGTILTQGRDSSVATVPASAIRTVNGESVVFVVQDGRIAQRAVSLGARDAQRDVIEVRAGVPVGAVVLIDPVASLRDGTPVRMLADSTPSLMSRGTTAKGGVR